MRWIQIDRADAADYELDHRQEIRIQPSSLRRIRFPLSQRYPEQKQTARSRASR
jgi:hypothetical protein